MTFATIAAPLVSIGNVGLVGILWHQRLKRGRGHPASFRSNIALSALLSITYSSVMYMVFFLLWLLHIGGAFDGREAIALFAIRGGLAMAAMGLLGGCFGRSLERGGIVSAAIVSGVLWLMAAVNCRFLAL
jgi:hypothetical protein